MLQGSKVFLRPVEKNDLKKRVEWLNNPDIQSTLNYETPVSLASTEAWFNRIVVDSNRKEFSVFCTRTEKYIGFCGLIHIERPVMKAELHCVIGDINYHNGGYGTDVYQLLTEYGFLELGLNKIYGYQLINNPAAHRVVEKLGWKRDGFLREDIFSHGQIRDRYIVSILRKDWNMNIGLS